MLPRWSPDGKQIAFFDVSAGKPMKTYLVSGQGGSPQELMTEEPHQQTDPNWSPDGSKIVFGGSPPDITAIGVLDMKTHQVSTLPGSEGLYSPRWSPDGRYIAALPADNSSAAFYDLRLNTGQNSLKEALVTRTGQRTVSMFTFCASRTTRLYSESELAIGSWNGWQT